MAPPPLPCATAGLSYPLYACEFDPHDPTTLIVGGGGGAGRSGVSNKITILNHENQSILTPASDIDLSRDEDSVTCLAVGDRRDGNLLVYAGINSSATDFKRGKNDHFRVFGVSLESKEKGPSIELVNKSGLFPASHHEKYQRLVRLAAPGATSQLTAVASGLGKDFQIALAELTHAGSVAPKLRRMVELQSEANDIDVLRTGASDEHQLVYCTDNEVYTLDFTPGQKKDDFEEPAIVFEIASDDRTGLKPTIRCLRYLSPTFVLMLVNQPKRSGVTLSVIRLPSKKGEKGRLAATVRLPRRVVQATALAVRQVGMSPAPGAKLGQAQFAIAVAGHDSSISLFTLEHQSVQSVELVWDLLLVHTISEAHPLQITGLAFAPFTTPKNTEGPANLALASISMGNTVSVHSLPLRRVVDKKAAASKDKQSPADVRYALALKGSKNAGKTVMILLTVIVLVMAVAGQVLLESIGESRDIFGVGKYVGNPFQVRSSVAPLSPVATSQTAMRITSTAFTAAAAAAPTEMASAEIVSEFLANIQAADVDGPIFLREHPVEAEAAGAAPGSGPSPNGEQQKQQDDATGSTSGGGAGADSEAANRIAAVPAEETHEGKVWEDVSDEQKELWKTRLKDAGHWAEHMGEAVFKGILFGELAGVVRAAVA
ncbi:hypothetical protein BROUX41_004165 [Berkeleyomyces rouxiae]|uniref:uncharacterized protein n=1 Tax=Berkeleyomyces rouxiae TaxID=2035830 RepID=UPI003B7D8E79